MIKRYLLLIISLLLISACSSQNDQFDQQAPAPQAAIETREAMDSSVLKEEPELKKSKQLNRAPIIEITPEDDDMTRLD